MSAPLLATRDTLAAVLRDAIEPERARREPPPERATAYCLALADALLASGILRDPADLADDEALATYLAERFSVEQSVARWPHEKRLGRAARLSLARLALHDLAAALSEDPS